MDERLTYRNQYGEVDLFGAESSILREGLETEREVNALTAALNKLADYEDAEERGRLVRLPCKAGDPIFSRWNWCVPLKTHKRGEILIGEYVVLLAGMMYTREGAITPFICFGNGWGGICFEKPLDEVLEKCAFTLDGAFEQAEAALQAREEAQHD